MSPLTAYREQLHFTQEELATKSGISVRTIQRIESGTTPKGYTLEALSKALGINKEDLLTKQNKATASNKQLIKYINLSSILVMIVPFGSIIMPLLIMYWKKEINTVSKQIVSIQILWTLVVMILVLASSFLKNLLSLSNQITSFTILLLLVINLFIILRNTLEIEKNGKLYIHLNFSIL